MVSSERARVPEMTMMVSDERAWVPRIVTMTESVMTVMESVMMVVVASEDYLAFGPGPEMAGRRCGYCL